MTTLVTDSREIAMPTGVLRVDVAPGPFALDALLGFGARANARRGFLFVSKVLGKHWPSRPAAMRALHAALAAQLPADLPGPLVFVGLAETAVGLGQGVFDAHLAGDGAQEALFLHTTRYRMDGVPLIEFTEAHSHAPRQFLHLPVDATLRELFLRARTLVLVDDEASTGNTFRNLAAACRALNPALAHVHVVTLANFMGSGAAAELGRDIGLPVTLGAALQGSYAFEAGDAPPQAPPAQIVGAAGSLPVGGAFGRTGLAHRLTVPSSIVAALASSVQPGESVLVLGTGEFMHAPFVLACALEDRGIDVAVQSTTRSPILQWGAIGSRLAFADNYGEGVANYLYNVRPGQYAHVFICHETPLDNSQQDGLHALAAQLGARLIHFRSEHHVE
ncbi:phosphoribosyltransferase-like predicted ribonucleoside biosynthesis protein [Pseudoduganella lurida]|uniref:Phosphoribosyltransferase-like predicted ribonucleoside biosynthesis protein n=1 Tax=Pseudoduganella lurida TaxID=1036180 RepID=A0A562R3A6_9BURK|nr:phosphoribosyltransferase domain-containing protein [Pseudoduganella lurida]TWI63565.1 phosphoribosyltransferase-like predicted ribonucleoside biosynthesis protein [Pseudoduganella lurida]